MFSKNARHLFLAKGVALPLVGASVKDINDLSDELLVV
jgi:hypothetical protein